jgi:hypothetical protein
MAQYFTDFTEFSLGAGLPAGFSLRSAASVFSYSIVNESSPSGSGTSGLTGDFTGTKALKVTKKGLAETLEMVSWDAAGQASIADIIVRGVTEVTVNDQWGAATAMPASGATRQYVAMNLGSGDLRQWVNGDSTTVASGITLTIFTPYYIRLQRTGSVVRSAMSFLEADILGTPAGGWKHNTTDPNPSLSGYSGFVARNTNGDSWIDFIGIGTNGDTAPVAAVSGGTPLAVPGSWTFTKTAGVRQINGSWAAVSGAATYDWQVERWNGTAWVAFLTGSTASTSFTLTSSNGVEFSTQYRSRVRAVPA